MSQKAILFFFIFNFVFFLYSNLRETVRYENYLQNQLESYLAKILPDKTYLVTVNVQIKKTRKQEISKESSNVLNKEDNREPVFPPTQNNQSQRESEILPGLEFLEEDNNINQPTKIPPVVFNTKKVEKQEKINKEYNYVDEITIEAIDAQIILDKEIPTETINTVRRVITEKFDTTYQDKAIVNFIISGIDLKRDEEKLDINQITPPITDSKDSENQNLIDEFKKLREDLLASDNKIETFKDFLDNYGFIVYLFLGLLALLIIFLFFFLLIWFLSNILNKNNKKEKIAYPPYPTIPVATSKPSSPPIDNQRQLEKERKLEDQIKKLEEEQKKKLDDEQKKLEEEQKKLEEEQKKKADDEQKKLEEERILNEFGNKRKRTKYTNYIGEENEFIDIFLSDLLVARKYIFNLNQDDYLDLIHSFSNENIKKIFTELRKDKIIEEESPYLGLNELEIAQSKKRLFSRHLKGLEQYRKILKPQTSDVFGKLSLLKEDEVKLLFSSLGVDAIADLSRIIDSSILNPYIKSLNEKEKQNLLKAISLNRELSYDKLEDLRAQFTDKINEISKNIFIDKSQKNDIMFNILKTSQNKKELLNEIKKDNIEFYKKYSNYEISFIEFLKIRNDLKDKIIDGMDNKTLAQATINLNEEAEFLYESLPNNRVELIKGIAATQIFDVTKDEILDAQEKILDKFRTLSVS